MDGHGLLDPGPSGVRSHRQVQDVARQVPGGAATVRLEGQHLILEILVVFQVDNFKMKCPCGVAADSTAMMLMFSR